MNKLVVEEKAIGLMLRENNMFAAFDIFMCGDSIPEVAIEILRKRFRAQVLKTESIHRGADLLE